MGTTAQKLQKVLDTKEAIRTAIAAKGVDIPSSTKFSAYPEKIDSMAAVNGAIESYKVAAGENISAGDFVKFVAGEPSFGADASVNSGANAGKIESAVQIDDSRVFIAHSYGSSYYLYGVVITISGTGITVGTDTAISSVSYSGSHISTVQMDGSKVFIAHSYDSNYCLYGVVVTISGTSIAVGTDKVIRSVQYSGSVISAVQLDSSKVFIAHYYSGNAYLYGVVITISGTSFTAGTDTSINGSSNTGSAISAVHLDSSHVFIAHSYNSSRYLYGVVVSISGTSITVGTDTGISTSTRSGYVISAINIDSSHVFIAHSYGSSYYLRGVIVTISGTSITAGTDTAISSVSYSGSAISAVQLDSSNVFIAHSYGSSYYLYGVVITISGTGITVGTDTAISSVSYSGYGVLAIKNADKNVFIAHSCSTTYQLNAICGEYINAATGYKNNDIAGVAKTSGAEGAVIDVFVPESQPVTLITFTIDTATYQAESGMTWAQWVDSEYNTGNYQFAVVNGITGLCNGGTTYAVYDSVNRRIVSATDIINAGMGYTMAVDWWTVIVDGPTL